MSPLAPNTGTGSTGSSNPVSDLSKALTPQQGDLMGRQGTLSEWAGPYVADMLGKAKALTAEPYQVYQGPLTAGASELQQKYFEGLGKMGFPGQLGQTFSSTGAPTLPTASSTGITGGTQPTGIAAQYMNPYLSAVLGPQLAELQRQAQITQMNQGSKLTQAGAFGGGRQAIMDAETQRNLLSQLNKTIGEGYSSAYDKALQQFNTEQGQAKGLAELLGSAGATQRGIESEGIKADLAAFEEQRDAPYKQIQFEQSLLQGLPIQSVAAQYQQPSTASNVLNTMGGLMGLYEKLYPTTKTG